jgi:hypothetical protein
MMKTLVVVVVLGGLLPAGCGSGSPTSPSATAPLSAAVRSAMSAAIADEYRAETIYQGVIADFGPLAPFVNIVNAELRHSTAIARLFENRGLPVPANSWTVITVPHYPTVPAACAAGVVAERENIALYDGAFALDLPADVRRVFENNREASLVNHLPAFERCAA